MRCCRVKGGGLPLKSPIEGGKTTFIYGDDANAKTVQNVPVGAEKEAFICGNDTDAKKALRKVVLI